MEKQARRDNGKKKLFKIYNQAFSTVKKLITNRIHNVYFIFSEDHYKKKKSIH